MVKRLAICLFVLVAGLGSAALIPTDLELQPAAVRTDLPRQAASLWGEWVEPSEEERKILAGDTTIEKRVYSPFPAANLIESLEQVTGTIVVSGHDLNNSIHRPERCLPAQGFKGLQVSTEEVEVEAGGRKFPLTVQRIASYLEVAGADGNPVRVNHLTYYWFVGRDVVTHSHYHRTLVDMRDRLAGGFNQRWAYFSVSSAITDNLAPFGRSEEKTDALLRQAVSDIYDACVLHDQVSAPSG
jgi:hypothetical protein